MIDKSPSQAVYLVIPCLRESRRIGLFLAELCLEADSLGEVSVCVIDDGSGLEEAARMRALVRDLQVHHHSLLPLLALPENIGKGGAVYEGWSTHQGELWLMFVDADGSVSAKEVARLIKLARQEKEYNRAYFASRVKMLGRLVERLLRRHLMGRIYATLVSELLHVPVYDSQCGCKLVPRVCFENVREQLSFMGFSFDVDLLMALREDGCEVVEVPVDWKEIPGGTIHLIRDSWRMFCDVMRLRKRWR